jgi:hypothetical protein
MDSSLTLEDFDWLRKIEAATDAGRDPPPIPMNIAGKLGAFRFVKSNGLGGFIITGLPVLVWVIFGHFRVLGAYK